MITSSPLSHVTMLAAEKSTSMPFDWSITLNTRTKISTRKFARSARRLLAWRTRSRSTWRFTRVVLRTVSSATFVGISLAIRRRSTSMWRITKRKDWTTLVTTAERDRQIWMRCVDTFAMFMRQFRRISAGEFRWFRKFNIKINFQSFLSFCEKAFKRPRDLKDHEAAIHTHQELYECTFCAKTLWVA